MLVMLVVRLDIDSRNNEYLFLSGQISPSHKSSLHRHSGLFFFLGGGISTDLPFGGFLTQIADFHVND